MSARDMPPFREYRRRGNLVESRHPSRENDAPTFRGNLSEIREVGDFARRNFPVVHAERSEGVYRHEIERRAHEADPFPAAEVGESGIVGKRQMDRAAHFELTLLFAGCFFLIFGFRSDRGNDQFGHCRLEFDVIGSGSARLVDHTAGKLEIAVVVNACFGDDYDVVIGFHWCRMKFR